MKHPHSDSTFPYFRFLQTNEPIFDVK